MTKTPRWKRILFWCGAGLAIAVVVALFIYHDLPPATRGEYRARLDHFFGTYEIKVHSRPAPWEAAYRELLLDRYGVELDRVAGMFPTREQRFFVDSYNETSRRLLFERYGKDVLKECREEAKRRYEAWREGDRDEPPPGTELPED